MGDPVCVAVVANDPMLEAGATSALRSCPDLSVVTPGEPAVVTVVMVDSVGADELAAVRATRSAPHRPEVVIVATDVDPGAAQRAIAAGARGLLRRREATPVRLARTVLAAAGGDCTVPPDMLNRLLDGGLLGDRDLAAAGGWSAAGLSDRERAVLSLVADGHETSEIARTLSYSTRTVTTVVHDITRRFRLRNRAHAVAYALRAGLL